jgi:hypothetical protein
MLFKETVAVYCTNLTEHRHWVRISQETYYVSATEIHRLMLFKETVAVHCKNHMEHTDTLCVQNADVFHVKARRTYSDHWTLKRESQFSDTNKHFMDFN